MRKSFGQRHEFATPCPPARHDLTLFDHPHRPVRSSDRPIRTFAAIENHPSVFVKSHWHCWSSWAPRLSIMFALTLFRSLGIAILWGAGLGFTLGFWFARGHESICVNCCPRWCRLQSRFVVPSERVDTPSILIAPINRAKRVPAALGYDTRPCNMPTQQAHSVCPERMRALRAH